MAEEDRPTIKDDDRYEALRREGASKEKAARIANTSPEKIGKENKGRAHRYEDRTKQELYEKARNIGIKGASKMNKSELIDALRNH